MRRLLDAGISAALGIAAAAVGLSTRWWQLSALVPPAPSQVACALAGFCDRLLVAAPGTDPAVGRILGLTLGAALGFGAGLLLGHSRRLRRWLTPYLVLSQVTPKLALAPLFIVWFGFGTCRRW